MNIFTRVLLSTYNIQWHGRKMKTIVHRGNFWALSGYTISTTFLWVLGRCCILPFKKIIIMVWKLGFFPSAEKRANNILQLWFWIALCCRHGCLCSDLRKFAVFCIIFLIWMVREDKFWVADYDCCGILRKLILPCSLLPVTICINSSRFPGSAEKLVKEFHHFQTAARKY